MRLIDADKLKKHYAWWGNTALGKEKKKLFDEIVDLQPTINIFEKTIIVATYDFPYGYSMTINGKDANKSDTERIRTAGNNAFDENGCRIDDVKVFIRDNADLLTNIDWLIWVEDANIRIEKIEH